MIKFKSNTFYCFSPPIMLATLIIEFSLALYSLIRYKRSVVSNLITAILIFLGIFQLAEYFVCGGFGLRAETWSKIGFMVIAVLPAYGIHLIIRIAKKNNLLWISRIAYFNSFIWLGIFSFAKSAFKSYSCGGNYIIFQLNYNFGEMYFIYYYFWLFAGILLAYYLRKKSDKKTKLALKWMIIGYGAFMIPTTVVNTLNPQTSEGLPSILCGFAVIFALILIIKVAPLISKKQKI